MSKVCIYNALRIPLMKFIALMNFMPFIKFIPFIRFVALHVCIENAGTEFDTIR